MVAQKKKEGRKTGPKSKYNSARMDAVIAVASARGCTDQEIADVLGVGLRTLAMWKTKHPTIRLAMKEGKDIANQRVEKALYSRALGCSTPDVHVSIDDDGKTVLTPLERHYPPDTTAARFWLTNRDPRRWRDKQEVKTVGEQVITHEVGDSVKEMMARIRRKRTAAA